MILRFSLGALIEVISGSRGSCDWGSRMVVGEGCEQSPYLAGSSCKHDNVPVLAPQTLAVVLSLA